jgi:hypothetical protein
MAGNIPASTLALTVQTWGFVMRKPYPFAAAFIIVGVLAGCSSPAAPEGQESTTSSSTPKPTVSATPEAAAEPTGARADPLPYGTVTTVETASIWNFTVHDVQTDANAWVAQADAYNEAPTAGNVWVGGYLSVTVKDVPETAAITDPVSPSASINPVFVGASGTVYDFWTNGFPATFASTSWNSLPDVFVSPGTSWDQPYAMQVPASDVAGGSFAVRHETSGRVLFFA